MSAIKTYGRKPIGSLFCNGLSLLTVAAVSVTSAIHAETWYVDATQTSTVDYLFDKESGASAWTNSVGEYATVLGQEDVLVVSYDVICEWTASTTVFPAKELRIGEEDASASALFYHQAGGLKRANIVWNNGTIQSKCERKSQIQSWTVTVKGSEKGTEHLWCCDQIRNDPYYSVSHGVSGTFTGDANQEVKLKLLSAGCNSDPVGSIQLFPFSGTNINWLGKFTVSDCANYVIGQDDAAGSPDVPRDDAITLGSHARFMVASGVTPNSARGIKITGEDVRFLAQTFAPSTGIVCTNYTLNMPISGEYGFAKYGPGRVAIGGEYTAGAIVVQDGTLELLASATVKSGTQITVKSGATLVCHFPLSNLSILPAEGAVVRREVDVAVVPFDATTISATPVALDSDVFDVTNMLAFSLSEPVSLPQHETNEFKILTYSGNKTLSANMFMDKTGKNYGLPNTSLSIVSEDGVQSVWLKTYPVIVSLKNISSSANKQTINGCETTWSDGLMPHTGADYLLTHRFTVYSSASKEAFTGSSLTFAGTLNTQASPKLILSNDGPITMWPTFTFKQSFYGKDHVISGKLKVHGSYGDERNVFTFKSDYHEGTRKAEDEAETDCGSVSLSADLTGSGTLVLTSPKRVALNGLIGNNLGYTGRIIAYSGSKKDTLSDGMRIRINNASNLGGRLDEFKYDAVTLRDKAFLYPLNDVLLDSDVNRGLYVSDAGVECSSGTTFSCAWPVRLGGTFSKIGKGTLKLAGPISYGADGNGETGRMEVRDGCLSVLADAAVAGLSLVFSNETTFAVDCGLTTGITIAPSVLTADGSAGKVNLTFDEDRLPASPPERISATVATLPAGSDDIGSLFVLPHRVSRYTVFRLEKTTMEKDSVYYNVYELKANVRGTVICVR